jgi:EAL domain-containing protein (putative c-di-GMP-specific phosphodiesterase class I)
MMYQPIFNLDTNSLAGFEALIRWRHPTRGIVGPVDFIPLAEETGFIFELGAFALSQSCSDMVELLRDLTPENHLTVSVNLSPKQFARQGLVDQIEQAIISSGIQPSSLVLEITESSIIVKAGVKVYRQGGAKVYRLGAMERAPRGPFHLV